MKALAYTMIAVGLVGIANALLIAMQGEWTVAAGHALVMSWLLFYGSSVLRLLWRAQGFARGGGAATVRFPAPSGASAFIAAQVSARRRWMLFFILVGPVTMSLVAVFTRSSVRDTGLLPILSAIGIGFAILAGAVWFFTVERPAERDQTEPLVCLSSGPVDLARIAYSNGWVVRIGDAAFVKYGRYTHEDWAGLRALTHVREGTVDYAPHSHVIFEVRDASGKSLYRMEGYQARHDE